MCQHCLRKMNSEGGKVYSICILQFSCFIVQLVQPYAVKTLTNKPDETLTDYSFLSMYNDTKSKNCLKRRYRIRL